MNQNDSSIIDKPIQVIPKKLYFCSTDKNFKENESTQRFNIDDLIYVPFNYDFGPLKISYIYQYINQLTQLLEDPINQEIKFWQITSTDYKKYTNSILLACAYKVIVLKKSPQQAFQPFSKYNIPSFRDSSSGKCAYQCTILDCLKGLSRAISLNWFSLQNFDVKTYSYYDKVQNGDINEIIKNKIYGFGTPSLQETDALGYKQMNIHKIGSVLRKIGISIVIHLAEAPQLAKCLQKQGIKNYSLPFAEFTTPAQQLVEKFIQVVKNSDRNAKIGVHCKTGLGKVGTMIGCYAIKQYRFPANEFIGWIRLCRPGTVVGPQQVFLVEYDKQQNNKEESSSSIDLPKSLPKKREQTPSRGALARKNSLKLDNNVKKPTKNKQSDLKKSLDILNMFQQKMNGSLDIVQPSSATYPRKTIKSSLLDDLIYPSSATIQTKTKNCSLLDGSSDSSQSFNEKKQQFKKQLQNSSVQSPLRQQKQVNTASSSQQKQGIHALRTKFKHYARN